MSHPPCAAFVCESDSGCQKPWAGKSLSLLCALSKVWFRVLAFLPIHHYIPLNVVRVVYSASKVPESWSCHKFGEWFFTPQFIRKKEWFWHLSRFSCGFTVENEHSTQMIRNCTHTWAWMLCCVLVRRARRVWGGLRTCENRIVLEKQLELRNRTVPRMAGKVLLTAKKPHFNRHASLYVQSVPWWTKWVVGKNTFSKNASPEKLLRLPCVLQSHFPRRCRTLKMKAQSKGDSPRSSSLFC